MILLIINKKNKLAANQHKINKQELYVIFFVTKFQ